MPPPDSHHLVDPELLPMVDSMPPLELSVGILPAMRARPPMFEVRPEDLRRSELVRRNVPGPKDAPEVGVAIYRPAGAEGALPCILHIHGGGYVSGSLMSNEAVHRPLAADLQCVIVSVDYRLAPETRFPGAVEDCYAVLAWINQNAAELGVDVKRLGVMGESAGGGLAAGLALLVRDRAEYSLAFQHLIYPMIDDRTCTTSEPHPFAGEFVWTAKSNHFGWSCLLGQEPGSEGVSPYAAAARAEDVAGLPPTYIATGSLDLFLEEDLEYARRLLRSGVPVELHIYPGAFHAFQWVREANVTLQAGRDSQNALGRALA
jgi:triacylglycerol lipase